NRKDAEGMNVFQGGFLGLDNIGVFDRSASLPTGGHIEQSDGTSWMGMFSLNMLAIALELARENPAYEGVASKFFEHFVQIAHATDSGERRLLSIVSREKLSRVLRLMLDESEFLSPYGIRAVSQFHRDHPCVLVVDGNEHRVDYEPAESSTGLFGGNSNWRGPIWFPINYLLIEALQKFDHFYGPSLQ